MSFEETQKTIFQRQRPVVTEFAPPHVKTANTITKIVQSKQIKRNIKVKHNKFIPIDKKMIQKQRHKEKQRRFINYTTLYLLLNIGI